MFQAVVNAVVPENLNQIRPVKDLKSGRDQVFIDIRSILILALYSKNLSISFPNCAKTKLLLSMLCFNETILILKKVLFHSVNINRKTPIPGCTDILPTSRALAFIVYYTFYRIC